MCSCYRIKNFFFEIYFICVNVLLDKLSRQNCFGKFTFSIIGFKLTDFFRQQQITINPIVLKTQAKVCLCLTKINIKAFSGPPKIQLIQKYLLHLTLKNNFYDYQYEMIKHY